MKSQKSPRVSSLTTKPVRRYSRTVFRGERVLRLLPLLLMIVLAAAASPADERIDAPQLRDLLRQLDVGVAPEDLPAAPIPGFLEIVRDMQILYVAADGSMLINGDVLAVRSETNLTEKRRAALRREKLNAVAAADRMVLHAAPPTRARIIVFTDTDCPYCLRFQRQHEKLLQRGIEINYLFYPRSGPESDSWSRAVAVWCAPDRLRAYEAALNGSPVTAARCPNPVSAHYELARQLNLKGTPAIMTPDGAMHYGVTDIAEILDAVSNPAY